MAPAAVQTKHSVWLITTSAPALRAHSSIAGPGTPSRSPIAITFLSASFMSSPSSCGLGAPGVLPPVVWFVSLYAQPLERGHQLFLGYLALQAVNLLAVVKEQVCRQRQNACRSANRLVLGRIDLHDRHSSAKLPLERFHVRHHGQTRLTLGAPEVDKDRAMARQHS